MYCLFYHFIYRLSVQSPIPKQFFLCHVPLRIKAAWGFGLGRWYYMPLGTNHFDSIDKEYLYFVVLYNFSVVLHCTNATATDPIYPRGFQTYS